MGCQEHGAHLASIHSSDENRFVRDLAANASRSHEALHTWIGFHKDCHGDWKWSDETETDYLNWYTNQPDNYNGHATESPENCVHSIRNALVVQHAGQGAPFQPCCINACSDINQAPSTRQPPNEIADARYLKAPFLEKPVPSMLIVPTEFTSID
ncbi:lectin C-type domain protein [Ancylostoma ceylanicum]|uniref:Lectin C-type domain protein n=1 Tax=Ancylostoma ceylanicum TaxID=53326 RepID=A0A0D6MAM1_9BILA|nr:lectin C-type domain protein [Ancylostoma ceylanicum]